MNIIDFRMRPPCKEFLKDFMFEMEDSPNHAGIRTSFARRGYAVPRSLQERSMAALLHEMAEAHVVAAAVSVRKSAGLTNELLEALIAAHPGTFIGLAGIQPKGQVDQAIAEIQRYVVQGSASCVFMEPGIDTDFWFVDDEQFFPIYAYCEAHDIPICLLFGGIFHRTAQGLDYDIYKPTRIEHILTHFPKLRIVLSHAGLPWTTMACMCALNYDTLYLSPDFYMLDTPGCQDYIVGANGILQDKIIFGSCYPAAPVGDVVAGYTQVLKPEVREKVFYKNALNFLGETVAKALFDHEGSSLQ